MKTKKIICKALMMMLLLSEFHAGYAQTGYQYYSVNQPAQLFITAHASVSGVCPGIQVTLTGSGAVTYAWSGGVNDGVAFAPANTASYIVTGTDANNCTATDSIDVFVQLPYQDEELCLVSVDTVLWKNKVMWSKTQDVGTISYNIYKETGLNEFSLLGNVPISQSSVFIDYSSAPESHGDKYKITAIDTCWAESELSYYHKTMNLTVAVNGATMGLNWDDYIDESGSYVPSKFYIFRGSTPTNIAMYDSISATFHSYNDYNVFDSYYYMVAVKKAGGCNTNKTGENNFSFSNKGLNFTGIEEIENSVNLKISPNPFCDKTIIIFDNSKNNFNYLILSDITGKEILRITDISSGKVEIEKGDLAPGVYFVEISGNNVLREKLVIE